MRFVIGFLRFWYEFIVGDDWRIAVAVVGALILTSLLAHTHPGVWWLLPLAVVAVLGTSLWRETRAR